MRTLLFNVIEPLSVTSDEAELRMAPSCSPAPGSFQPLPDSRMGADQVPPAVKNSWPSALTSTVAALPSPPAADTSKRALSTTTRPLAESVLVPVYEKDDWPFTPVPSSTTVPSPLQLLAML
jgi:hypothetical protein